MAWAATSTCSSCSPARCPGCVPGASCSIGYAAIAAAINIPGGQLLLVAMMVFSVISTIVTTRNSTADYGKALRALRS
jgi:hypothetical protein